MLYMHPFLEIRLHLTALLLPSSWHWETTNKGRNFLPFVALFGLPFPGQRCHKPGYNYYFPFVRSFFSSFFASVLYGKKFKLRKTPTKCSIFLPTTTTKTTRNSCWVIIFCSTHSPQTLRALKQKSFLSFQLQVVVVFFRFFFSFFRFLFATL